VYAYFAGLVEDLNVASFQRFSWFEFAEKCSGSPAGAIARLNRPLLAVEISSVHLLSNRVSPREPLAVLLAWFLDP
jgi:hypothetical protein